MVGMVVCTVEVEGDPGAGPVQSDGVLTPGGVVASSDGED